MDNRCKKCEILYASEQTREQILAHVEKIPPKERANRELWEQRLATCAACEHRLKETCLACGCYVEFRTAFKRQRCPKKRWQ